MKFLPHILALTIILVAFLNPKRFVIVVALILLSPVLLLQKVFLVAIQLTHSKMTQKLDRGHQVTELAQLLWLFLKLRNLIFRISKFFRENFNKLVGDEMLKVVAVDRKVEYVPVDFRESGEVSFTLKRLGTDKLAEIQDNLAVLNGKGQLVGYRLRQTRVRIVREMLVGWKGLTDENGNPIVFNQASKKLMYDLIPPAIQAELEARFGGGDLDWEAFEAQEQEGLDTPEVAVVDEEDAGDDADEA